MAAMTNGEKRARADAIVAWLRSEFPTSEILAQEFASTFTPVFRVVQDYVETQLEMSLPVFEQAPEVLTGLLADYHIPAKMRANAGKRILVWRHQDITQVDVESMRES